MPLDFTGTRMGASVCPHDCPSTCALDVEMLPGNRIGRVHGSRDNSYTRGVVCAKVARYAERHHHPDRLGRSLRRTGEKGIGRAAFVPIGWDDALDLVADGLTRAAQRDGAEAVWPYYYAGTMGHVQRDGINRLRHVMGYSGQHSTICSSLADAGWVAGAGAKRGTDPREMADSDLIVVWGGNPVSTQINVMTWISEARKRRGAKLVVVDPYRTGTAAQADIHLMPRPGTDGALACAVMHVLFREGMADRGYLARYTDEPAGLEAHLESRDPAWAAEISGVPEAAIIDFARLYGRTESSFIRIGYGFSRSRNGAAQVFAVSCLPAVTGAWRHPGGGALYTNGALYPLNKTLIDGFDRRDPSVRQLDMSRIGPVLTGNRRDLGEGPPVTALFIQNTNPMMVAPASLDVRSGFSRPDLFTAVHEQFMTETAAMADVVLPATTFLEHDDLYTSGGHTHLQIARKLVEPHEECRSNHEVLQGLATRLGADHPGFGMTAWELIEATLARSGLPGPEAFDGGRWLDMAKSFEKGHFLDGFGHADGRFHFRAVWPAPGLARGALPAFPDHVPVIDAADAEHPFRLVAAPARSFLNSTFTETPSGRAREGQPAVLVHPDDLAELGVSLAGGTVRLGNRQASLLIAAKPFVGLQRGVVVVESIWPNAAFVEGVGINALVSAEPGLPNGGAVFHDTAIWIRAENGPMQARPAADLRVCSDGLGD